jgi:hypothetical protein
VDPQDLRLRHPAPASAAAGQRPGAGEGRPVTPFQFGVLLAPAGPPALLGRCADAAVEHDPAAREIRAYFDRAGPSLVDAVVAAVLDIDAGGLTPLTVAPDDDVVTLGAVAARLAVSRRVAEGLLHDSPPPLWRCADEPVYRWSAVTQRLRIRGDPASTRIFEAANLALRLRTLTRADAALAGLARLVDGETS